MDTLAQDWSAENNWLCPPVHLIIVSVRHRKSCSGSGALILPEWPSASFWPFLRERSSQFKSFVVDVFVLPAINDLLLEGPGQRQIYASRTSVFRSCPKFRMLALRLDFRRVALSAQQSLLERIGAFVFLLFLFCCVPVACSTY